MRVGVTIGALMGAFALAACQSSGPLEYPNEMISGVQRPPEPEPLAPRADEWLPSPQVAQADPVQSLPHADLGTSGIDDSDIDDEELELRRAFSNTDLSVLRDGESLVLQLDGDMLFAPDAAELTSRGHDLVLSLASMFNRYPSTYVNIDGFTAGARMLSQERADAFAIELEHAGVAANRLSALGHDDSPVAKVEITLEPEAG